MLFGREQTHISTTPWDDQDSVEVLKLHLGKVPQLWEHLSCPLSSGSKACRTNQHPIYYCACWKQIIGSVSFSKH